MKTLVLVHGFMGGGAQWNNLVPDLSRHYDLITPDLPGFGANAHQKPLTSIGDYADWVISQLTAQGVDRYHLLGHSMGGMVAQEIVRRDTDRIDKLILYATGAVGVIPGRFETIAESKRRAREDGPEKTARRISATWFLEKETAPAFGECAKIAAQAGGEAIDAGLDAMAGWSGQEALSQINKPTLIMWGDRDRTYAWAQTELLWTSISGASLAVIPGCAHAVHLEKPALFLPPLMDFLNRTD